MKKLIGLLACLGLVLALGGCGGKGDSGSSGKSSPSPSPSGPPGGGRPSGPPGGPSGPSGAPDAPVAPEAKPDVKPAVPAEVDDHSDDPWYDEEEEAKKPGPGGEKKPAAGSEKTTPGATSSWEPDKALLDQLEPYQDVEGYQIRLPKGYTLTQLPLTPPGGMKLFFWMGPRQPDGSASFIQVAIAAIPPQEAKDGLANALAGTLATLKAQQRDWRQTPEEKGQLNGLPCLRVHAEAVAAQTGGKVRGFLYAAQDGSTLAVVSGFGPGENAEALKPVEAAALTFRKK